jgi:acyl-CoA synthetase (AMP-forming)/AMP-acid ligase II
VPYNVNYRYRAEELRYLFANADSAAIIHGAEFSPIVRDVRGDVPTLKVTVAVEDGSGADTSGSVSYGDLMAHEPGGPWARHEDDILLCYTGGTTGMPKGVMWPHRAFLFACAGGAGFFNPHGPVMTPQDIESRARDGYPLKIFPLAPLMHMAAMWALWGALAQRRDDHPRRRSHVRSRTDARHRRARGREHDPVRGRRHGHAAARCAAANPGRWNLAHVVNLGSGGAVFSQHLKDDLKALVPSAGITDGLGASETGMSGMAEKSEEGVMRLPANEFQQVVVDNRIGTIGETGFIARTGNTPVGYYGDPVKTAETFVTIDGKLWAVSGDAGRLDDDSKITVFGRGSTCINTGGEKVFPEEVEEALRTHPGIFDAVVAGQPDERWGERVIGIVSPRAGVARPDLADVKAASG